MRPNLVSNRISRCWRVALHHSGRPKPPCTARITGLTQKTEAPHGLVCTKVETKSAQRCAEGADGHAAVRGGCGRQRTGKRRGQELEQQSKGDCFFIYNISNARRAPHPPRRARCKLRARRAPTAMRHPRMRTHAAARCAATATAPPATLLAPPCAAARALLTPHAVPLPAAARPAQAPPRPPQLAPAAALRRRHCPHRTPRRALVQHAVPLSAAGSPRPAAHRCERRGAQ